MPESTSRSEATKELKRKKDFFSVLLRLAGTGKKREKKKEKKKIISVQGIRAVAVKEERMEEMRKKSRRRRDGRKKRQEEYTEWRCFIRDDEFYSNTNPKSWCVGRFALCRWLMLAFFFFFFCLFHVEYLCRCVCSLGFSLACVCSLNNKYHKYIKPRKTATSHDSIERRGHEAQPEVASCLAIWFFSIHDCRLYIAKSSSASMVDVNCTTKTEKALSI